MTTAVVFDNNHDEPKVIGGVDEDLDIFGSDNDDDDNAKEEGSTTEDPEDSSQFRTEEEIAHAESKMKDTKAAPFQLLRWQEGNKKQVVRSKIYEELRSYEAQRRITFSQKLEATQLYFNSLVDLLQNSFDETAKVYRLALGTSIAQSQYARAITQRGAHQAPRESSPSSALLHSWQEANTILAATLEESAVDIEQNVVSVLSEFQDALQDQKNQFENIGKPILRELEHMESQVQQTWDAYWKTASKSMDKGRGAANHSFQSTTEAEALEEEEHIPTEDLWVVEMQYQISVSLQRSTWEKRGPEIVRLASSSKEMEVTRRIKLNECMVNFLHCLQKLFKTIGEDNTVKMPNAAAILDPLANLQLDIEKAVQSQVEASLPDEISKLSLPDDSAASFGLESDGLVLFAKVLEWKNSFTPMSAADRWRTALVVITVDEYLHLFDLTPYCHPQIYPGCDPSIAMEQLFPFFKAEDEEGESDVPANLTIREKMVPEKTFRLAKHCSFQLLADECCEITQKVPTGKAGRLMGKKQKPAYKAQLRVLSSDPGSSDKDSFFEMLKEATRS